MKECMILNACSMVAGSVAIAVGCYVTKSAWPLLAFMLIPKWEFSHNTSNKEDEEDE